MFIPRSSCFCFICIVRKTRLYISEAKSASIYSNDLDQSSKAVGNDGFVLVAKDGVNKFIESNISEMNYFEKQKSM